MILTYNEKQQALIQQFFGVAMVSANQLPIIYNFITQLEKYINDNGLCSEEEYPFTIIGEDSLNLSPLGIDVTALIGFCKTIRENQDDLNTTLSNYLKALKNSPVLERINDTGATNACFVIYMYIKNPLHMDILNANDPEELLHNWQTPLNVKNLINDPDGVYYYLLNLDNNKEENDSSSSENEYTAWDL
jgi:hypothetical protein